MAPRTRFVTLAACALLAGCGGQTLAGDAAGSGGQGSGGPGGSGGTSCTTHYSSNLPGASIHFPDSQRCVFSLAEVKAGIDFQYEVLIAQPITGVVSLPSDMGGCSTPGPSGLYVGGQIDGNGQHYCLCDIGLCTPSPALPVTLEPGTYPGTFGWPGVNWTGPSDTNNPYGAPFPPGNYQVTVSARGNTGSSSGPPYSVSGVLDFTLTK